MYSSSFIHGRPANYMTSKPKHPLDDSFSHLSITYHPSQQYVTHVRLNRPGKRNAIFTGEDFSADDALKIGFVSRISSSENQLIEEANKIISKIVANSPVAVSVTKASLNYSRDHTVREGLDHIATMNSSALMSEDLVKSFMISSGAGESAEFAPLRQHSRL